MSGFLFLLPGGRPRPHLGGAGEARASDGALELSGPEPSLGRPKSCTRRAESTTRGWSRPVRRTIIRAMCGYPPPAPHLWRTDADVDQIAWAQQSAAVLEIARRQNLLQRIGCSVAIHANAHAPPARRTPPADRTGEIPCLLQFLRNIFLDPKLFSRLERAGAICCLVIPVIFRSCGCPRPPRLSHLRSSHAPTKEWKRSARHQQCRCRAP